MKTVIQVLGIVIVAAGIVYLLKPDVMKWLMEFFKRGRRIYLAGLIRLALGIVFLLAARECDITWVIVTFGILFLVSGILIFMLGAKRARSVIEWWQKQPVLVLRVLALIASAIGAVIIYSA
jgi:uncharacterized membrane protein HdeD (DUF308 family)